jgi:DNA-binding response OmpR family regulator
VVLMSGYQDQGDRVEGAGFLAKPFSLTDLLGTVRTHLDTPAS